MKDKKTRLVKKVLYKYPDMMKGAVQSTVEWAESNMAVDYSKVAVQTSPSNYKEAQLCKILDENLANVRWCYVVEKVLDHYRFEPDKQKFIREHYFLKKGETAICLDVGISRATLYRWQEEILDIAYRWAIELKVIGE